jgi:hypothetical protein
MPQQVAAAFLVPKGRLEPQEQLVLKDQLVTMVLLDRKDLPEQQGLKV